MGDALQPSSYEQLGRKFIYTCGRPTIAIYCTIVFLQTLASATDKNRVTLVLLHPREVLRVAH